MSLNLSSMSLDPVLKLFLGDLCFILPAQHVIRPVQHVNGPVQHVIGPVQHVIGPVQHVMSFDLFSMSLDPSNMSFYLSSMSFVDDPLSQSSLWVISNKFIHASKATDSYVFHLEGKGFSWRNFGCGDANTGMENLCDHRNYT
ncbi:hypothetical protein TNCV_4889621 [Trichonephila clavipes]|nr:hypothetical protein TNCV_4889621 [Trichonephila clavipes]